MYTQRLFRVHACVAPYTSPERRWGEESLLGGDDRDQGTSHALACQLNLLDVVDQCCCRDHAKRCVLCHDGDVGPTSTLSVKGAAQGAPRLTKRHDEACARRWGCRGCALRGVVVARGSCSTANTKPDRHSMPSLRAGARCMPGVTGMRMECIVSLCGR